MGFQKTSLLIFLLGFILFLGFTAFDQENKTALSNQETESHKIYALKIPQSLDFSGERVPLDQPDIRERLGK